MRRMVETRSEFLRDHLSLVYPKSSCPKTVPAKVMAEMFDTALEFLYVGPYIIPNNVDTDPITYDLSVCFLIKAWILRVVYIVDISVRKQSSTTGHHRPNALPS
jgi:hypothetical protein